MQNDKKGFAVNMGFLTIFGKIMHNNKMGFAVNKYQRTQKMGFFSTILRNKFVK